EGGLEVGRLIDENNMPTDASELARIRKYTLSKEMYRSNVVSNDGTVTVIIARLKENSDKIAVARKMKTLVSATKGSEKVYFGGIPFQMISLADMIQRDMIRLIPLVVILLVITLALSFKTVRGVLLPLAAVLISTTWALGIMSLFKIDITIASNAMPILLIAIGSAYGIHMVTKYNEDIFQGENKLQSIRDALGEVGVPILLAGITTLIGFLAFLTSNLTLIKQFGIFTGIGVVSALLVSITFIPALLSFMAPPKVKLNRRGQQDTFITRLLDGLGHFVFERRKLILLLGLLIFVSGILSLFRVHREVNMVDYFKKSSDIRQAEDMMEAKLGGSIPIQILVKGDLKEPAVLKSIVDLEKFLQTVPDVSSPQSIADLICEMNDVMNNRYSIPATREGVANLWFFIDGNEVLPQLIHSNATEGLIQAKLGTVNTGMIIGVVRKINEYLAQNMDTTLVQFRLADLPAETLTQLEEMRTKEIIRRLNYDIRRYSSDFKFKLNPNAEKLILQQCKIANMQYDENFYQNLENDLSDFFSSDQTDLVLTSASLRRQVVRSLVKYVQKNGDITNSSIQKVLKRVVPFSYYRDDPDLPAYTAESVTPIISDHQKWERVNKLVAQLGPMLPGDLLTNKNFTRKLFGDLWIINDSTYSVPLKMLGNRAMKKRANDPSLISMSIRQTGMPIIFKDLDHNIVTSQITSLIFAIGLVFILLSFQFKSIIGGSISVIPIILTILFNFALMALFNIPLDAVTVMIGSVAVGIGIDYTIHFNSRFRLEMAKTKNQLAALQKTLETTGSAILINAISVMLGFLVLIFGSIVPMQRFGWMLAVTMFTSALFALTFLPAVIMLSHAKFIVAVKNASLNMLRQKQSK
ncbi:hypothetical protein DRI50_11060, partial [candidate division KSB1 bacterium]